MVFIFGLSENDKQRIIWESANSGVEFLPKDIEKDTGKKERSQHYESNIAFFHSPGILAKDFLQGAIDPQRIECIIIANAHTIHKDPGLQLCLALYKSHKIDGSIRAFTERCYEVSDLRKTMDLLWVRFILFFPRFEQNVVDSIQQYEVQTVEISLKQTTPTDATNENENKFQPLVSPLLIRVFDLLTNLHKAFIYEYGSKLKVGVLESLIYHQKTLEQRAVTDEQVKVLESILFFRHAFTCLLHLEPSVFHQYLQDHLPKRYDRPLWSQYPQVNPLYKASSSYAEENIPSPKLQWIIKIINDLPQNKRILILAEGSQTVSMICNFLNGFVPKTNGENIDVPIDNVDNDDEPIIDPTIFGIIEPPMILLEELHSQANILETFQPDFVIFWDITLLSLRRLEVYNSRHHKSVVAYLLSYKESFEYELMKYTAKHENEIFVRCIQDVKTLSLPKLEPYPPSTRKIIVDDREFRSSLPNSLLQVGFKVVPELITVGDYVLTNDIVIERKAYTDLVGSLRSGRLLQQLQRMKMYYPKPMLLIEFSETEQFNLVSAKDKNPLVMQKIAMILRLFPEIKIIWARNNLEAARTLMEIAQGKNEPNETMAMAMGSEDKNASNGASKSVKFLAAIPFLTNGHIEKIIEKCRNLRELAEMDRDDLMHLLEPSIGLKLYTLLHTSMKKET
ncbi:DNA repair endonuclease XPF [Histomonas meleagridis]|uniref:DNA repair endonuclease XPF n=1 Tax=Histomonas meleagridis TaxID=135588 RepID=UPI003559D4D1|nr:DNA repair endonuclease XPF [Histomonas meleagridis]KAH0804913.1 DNA repair endonuclease XPF [Histomonas meleagridis]